MVIKARLAALLPNRASPLAKPAEPKPLEGMKVMVVGTGGILDGRHIPIVSGAGADVVAVVGRDSDKNRAFAQKHGADLFPDVASAVEAHRPDAAVVATPPSVTAGIMEDLANRGIPFVAEKPAGVGIEGAKKVAAALDETGTAAAVGYHLPYWDSLEKARELIGDRPILQANAWWDTTTPNGAKPRGDNWWLQLDQSGGQINEQLSHLVHSLTSLMGTPDSVSARSLAKAGTAAHEAPDFNWIDLGFANGARAHIEGTHALPGSYGRGIRLKGEGFVVDVQPDRLTVLDDTNRGDDGAVLPAQTFTFDGSGTAKELGTETLRQKLGAKIKSAFSRSSGPKINVDFEATRKLDEEFLKAVRSGDPSQLEGLRSSFNAAMDTQWISTLATKSAETGGTPMIFPKRAGAAAAVKTAKAVGEPTGQSNLTLAKMEALYAGKLKVVPLEDIRPNEKVDGSIGMENGEAVMFVSKQQPLGENEARGEVVSSGVSWGTEQTQFGGRNPFAGMAYDPATNLFRPSSEAGSARTTQMGYMEVLRIVESNNPDYKIGDLVAAPVGHRTSTVLKPGMHAVPLPEGITPETGVFVGHMGAVAAQAVGKMSSALLRREMDAAASLQDHLIPFAGAPAEQQALAAAWRRRLEEKPILADPRSWSMAENLGEGLKDKNVVVVGAGVVGLLTAIMAKRSGAARVLVADPSVAALDVAKKFDLETFDSGKGSLGDHVKLELGWKNGQGEFGADAVTQAAPVVAGLNDAFEAVRPRGDVVDLGFYVAKPRDPAWPISKTNPAIYENLQLATSYHHGAPSVHVAQIGRTPQPLAQADRPEYRQQLAKFTANTLGGVQELLRESLIKDAVPYSQFKEVMSQRAAGGQIILKPDVDASAGGAA